MQQVPETFPEPLGIVSRLAKDIEQGLLRDDDEDHEDGGPERGQPGRESLDGQQPDQDDDRQQVVQPRFHCRPHLRQLVDFMIVRQIRYARGIGDQDDVADQQDQGDHPWRGITEEILDEIEDRRQHPDEKAENDHDAENPDQLGHPVHLVGAWQSLHAGLHGLEVHYVDQCDIGDHGRQESMLDDFDEWNADVFDHEECRGTHDRWRQLAVGRGSNLDGAGFFGRETDTLHERYRESSGRDHVRDRRTRDHAGHGGGDDRGLGRTATEMPHHGKSHADEIVAGTCPFQQGAEEHEQEYHGRGDADGDTEGPLRRQPVVGCSLVQRGALVGDHVRHVLPEEGVAEEHDGDDHQRRTEGTPSCLEQQDDTDDTDDDIHLCRRSHAIGKRVLENNQVEGRCSNEHRQSPVKQRYAVSR